MAIQSCIRRNVPASIPGQTCPGANRASAHWTFEMHRKSYAETKSTVPVFKFAVGPKIDLLRRRWTGLRWGSLRQSVDDLVGARVTQPRSSLVLDSAGIGFETVHMLAQAGVFRGELVDFLGEGLVFGALLLPAREAVAAVDHMPGKQHSHQHRRNRADAAAVGEVLAHPALQERLGGHGLGSL